MSKQHKSEVKVQKQTDPNTIQFKPKQLYKRKKGNQNEQGYMTSFKRIFENKLFHKELHSSGDHKVSPKGQSTSKRSDSAKDENQSKQRHRHNSNEKKNQSPVRQRRYTEITPPSLQNCKLDETIQTPTEKTTEVQKLSTILQSVYLEIKYISRMSVDCVLIGNENQLDLIQFKLQKNVPEHSKKWSRSLDKPIEGVTTSRLSESKILIWTDNELYIYECNPKNFTEQPHLIQKIAIFPERILSVQFVKRNIFFICCRSHIQIYEIVQVNKDLTVNKIQVKQFNCPSQFEVVQIPEHFDNNIKIFFANMHEYDQLETDKTQKEKQKQSSGSMLAGSKKGKHKDVFGLYYIEVEYNYNSTKVMQMKKVYEIKKDLRYEIKLLNISSSIFFMSLKTQVLAVKNGLIIDSVGVNFKFDNCYLKIIQNDILVHILTDKIEFYRLTLNYECLPEKIVVDSFDSIYFPRNLEDKFLSIVPINQGYGIFFQSNLKNIDPFQLKKGHINLWYGLTYPIPLQQKLNQILPTTDKIAETSFQALQTLCDMAGKMGLTPNEVYREVWRKSKKQTQKDYQILLLSRDYQIIQDETTAALKKRAEKLRLISKNEQICLDFLRVRIFDSFCTPQNLQQFSYCHFFNIKLNCYKHMQVERKRFQMEIYKRGRQTGAQQINRLMAMITPDKVYPQQPYSEIPIHIETCQPELNQQISNVFSEHFDQEVDCFIEEQQKLEQSRMMANMIKPPDLFATFLKTSKNMNQIQEDRKNYQLRERQKLFHEVQSKMNEPDYNQIKINIKDYYFYRDCNLKQLFLEIVQDLMAKEHTFQDHLKYFNLRVLIRNFKLCFRGIYEDIICQLISTYKHKITRLLQHFIELLPFQFTTLPQDTDESLCQNIWNPIQSQQFEECLFLSDITTIENRQTIAKFKDSLWFRRNNLTHHGVITATKQEMKQKYCQQNMKNIRDHYFYLFLSKFLQIKITLNNEIKQIEETYSITKPNNLLPLFAFMIDKDEKKLKLNEKKIEEAKAKVQKELLRTNELLKRVEELYPLVPVHLKGFIHLYFDLYNFLEEIECEEKRYSSIYEFLKLRDFELFKIFFIIERKIKGFIIKKILKKYEDSQLVENGREKFIQGIEHYFDSDLSQITDLKTILNRLNGQTREFHIQFEGLYDCLLSAIMNKIIISPNISVNLDELLIYIQNIPFSTANGRIFEKLLLIQQVHLEIEVLKRSRIEMSILQIKNNPQIVISALVQSQLKLQNLIPGDSLMNIMFPPVHSSSSIQQSSLKELKELDFEYEPIVKDFLVGISSAHEIDIDSVDQLKMYFWKCISELLCIKRHFYGNQHEKLLGFIFVTELLQNPKLVNLVDQTLQDDQVKELLGLTQPEEETKFKKALVFYSYKNRLSRFPNNYLQSEEYIRKVLRFLPKSDGQRQLMEQELRYCQIFKRCSYNMPYPLSLNKHIPVLDEIEYHIRQISSDQIDKLDVAKLFEVIETMRELIEPCLDLTQKTLDQRIREFQKILYEFVFFKYLRERKIMLALNMIDKLIDLNPNENCIIYDVFIIDVMIEQFSDTTGDLIIKLISYYYYSAKDLKELLEQLIKSKFTTSEFEAFIQDKINQKIKTNSYTFFEPSNYIFSEEVRQFTQNNMDPRQKLNLCHLFDAVYKHIEKSSEYIQKKRFFQIIYRIMLFNPYQAAQFIYCKQNEINLRGLRAFFSFMSQEFLINPEILLKVGTYIFIIILQRMKENFLISQQIKEYSKLDLNVETFDETSFEIKFSDVKSLTPMERLVFESYQVMKAKSEAFSKNAMFVSIRRQLQRVKQLYDEEQFLIKKNNKENMEKFHEVSYLKYNQWAKSPKLRYYLHNINEFSSYACYNYVYSSNSDKDDSYTTKGQEEFVYPRIEEWPNKVVFDKLKERHKILILGKYTRIPEGHCVKHKDSNSEADNLLGIEGEKTRERKLSNYLPEQYILQKKSVTDLHNYNTVPVQMQRNPSKGLISKEQIRQTHIKRAYSEEMGGEIMTFNNKIQSKPPLRKNQNTSPTVSNGLMPPHPHQTQSLNPILNFFSNGPTMMKQPMN